MFLAEKRLQIEHVRKQWLVLPGAGHLLDTQPTHKKKTTTFNCIEREKVFKWNGTVAELSASFRSQTGEDNKSTNPPAPAALSKGVGFHYASPQNNKRMSIN